MKKTCLICPQWWVWLDKRSNNNNKLEELRSVPRPTTDTADLMVTSRKPARSVSYIRTTKQKVRWLFSQHFRGCQIRVRRDMQLQCIADVTLQHTPILHYRDVCRIYRKCNRNRPNQWHRWWGLQWTCGRGNVGRRRFHKPAWTSALTVMRGLNHT